ncbi:glutathione S-transferase C-terminal-like protein [Mycena filopes]|nr:glutathione S-transferase C-terminal-like protein [Mycena filopes]
MSSICTLWTTDDHAQGRIIKATAAFAGFRIDIFPDYRHHEDNKKPEFYSRFPHGKVPAFESRDGFLLFEGIAIARYIAARAPNSGLLGKTLEETTLIEQWIHLADTELEVNTSHIQQLVSGILTPYSRPMHTAFVDRQMRVLRTLENHISRRTFFVGERITLTDIVVGTFVQRACISNIDTAARREIPNLFRHMDTIVNYPLTLADVFEPTPVLEKARV